MWLDLVLLGQIALLGLWGSAHCAAMCGPLCAVCLPTAGQAQPGPWGQAGWQVVTWLRLQSPTEPSPISGAPQGMGRFLLVRSLSYALLGMVISASAGVLRDMAQWAAWVKPVWLGVHVLLLMAGLWMAVTGRWVEFTSGAGAWLGRRVRQARTGSPGSGAWRLGLLWGLWPCGVLYGALMLAALTNHPLWGGAAMAAFALTSSPGLSLGAWLSQTALAGSDRLPKGWVRSSGLLVAAGALWALAHDALMAFVAWCMS